MATTYFPTLFRRPHQHARLHTRTRTPPTLVTSGYATRVPAKSNHLPMTRLHTMMRQTPNTRCTRNRTRKAFSSPAPSGHATIQPPTRQTMVKQATLNQNQGPRIPDLGGGRLLLERRVAVLGQVLAAAGEDDEVGAVLFQASHVSRERLLLHAQQAREKHQLMLGDTPVTHCLCQPFSWGGGFSCAGRGRVTRQKQKKIDRRWRRKTLRHGGNAQTHLMLAPPPFTHDEERKILHSSSLQAQHNPRPPNQENKEAFTTRRRTRGIILTDLSNRADKEKGEADGRMISKAKIHNSAMYVRQQPCGERQIVHKPNATPTLLSTSRESGQYSPP